MRRLDTAAASSANRPRSGQSPGLAGAGKDVPWRRRVSVAKRGHASLVKAAAAAAATTAVRQPPPTRAGVTTAAAAAAAATATAVTGHGGSGVRAMRTVATRNPRGAEGRGQAGRPRQGWASRRLARERRKCQPLHRWLGAGDGDGQAGEGSRTPARLCSYAAAKQQQPRAPRRGAAHRARAEDSAMCLPAHMCESQSPPRAARGADLTRR